MKDLGSAEAKMSRATTRTAVTQGATQDTTWRAVRRTAFETTLDVSGAPSVFAYGDTQAKIVRALWELP